MATNLALDNNLVNLALQVGDLKLKKIESMLYLKNLLSVISNGKLLNFLESCIMIMILLTKKVNSRSPALKDQRWTKR